MQHILTVVSAVRDILVFSDAMHILSLVREVDVVEQEWEVLEHPLGQVEVDRGALEEE